MAGAVFSLPLIRSRDFQAREHPTPRPPTTSRKAQRETARLARDKSHAQPGGAAPPRRPGRGALDARPPGLPGAVITADGGRTAT
jgi:hypothetical protein